MKHLHRSPRHALLLAILSAMASIALTLGCGSEGDDEATASAAEGAAAGSEGDTEPEADTALSIYSMRNQKLVRSAIEGFRAAHPELEVTVRYGGAELANAILEEGERSQADVFFAQDASTLGVLEAAGLFRALPEGLGRNVPATYRSADGKWIGTSGRARVLAYSTERLRPDQLPANVDALTEEAWRGRVGWAPENASFQSFVAAMIQLRGPERTGAWLRAMKANDAREFPANMPAVRAIARGEIDVALVNHYYLYRLRREMGDDLAVDNHYFRAEDAASMVNVSGAAVLASAPHPSAAAIFLEYLLSDAGQAHFVAGNNEFPVTGADTPLGLPAIGTLRAPTLNLAQLSDLQATQALLREAGVLH